MFAFVIIPNKNISPVFKHKPPCYSLITHFNITCHSQNPRLYSLPDFTLSRSCNRNLCVGAQDVLASVCLHTCPCVLFFHAYSVCACVCKLCACLSGYEFAVMHLAGMHLECVLSVRVCLELFSVSACVCVCVCVKCPLGV